MVYTVRLLVVFFALAFVVSPSAVYAEGLIGEWYIYEDRSRPEDWKDFGEDSFEFFDDGTCTYEEHGDGRFACEYSKVSKGRIKITVDAAAMFGGSGKLVFFAKQNNDILEVSFERDDVANFYRVGSEAGDVIESLVTIQDKAYPDEYLPIAKKALDSGFLPSRISLNLENNVAWIYATSPNYLDGKMALKYAQNLDRNPDDFQNLDTLAAAYARSGDFMKAIEIEQVVIEKAKAANINKDALKFYNDALTLYMSDKAYTDNSK